MVMPSEQAEAQAIVANAEPYLDMSIDELERAFEEALEEAESKSLPHRGDTDRSFWRAALVRLRRDLAEQEPTASATIGLAASQAVSWASGIGLDLSDYKLPIAILVAMAVRATWDQMKSGDHDSPRKDD